MMSSNANPADTGALGAGLAAGVTGEHTHAGEDVCVAGNAKAPVPTGAKHFVVTEDHATTKERVEQWVEHTPVHREYVTKVEATGRVNMPAGYVENATATERIIGEHTCYPTNTTTIHGVAGEAKTLAGSATQVETNRVSTATTGVTGTHNTTGYTGTHNATAPTTGL